MIATMLNTTNPATSARIGPVGSTGGERKLARIASPMANTTTRAIFISDIGGFFKNDTHCRIQAQGKLRRSRI